MGRKPLPAPKKQLNIAFDQNTRRILESEAQRRNRSIADEIRQRIERTIAQDAQAKDIAAQYEEDVEDVIQGWITRMAGIDEYYGQRTSELGWDAMWLAHAVRFSDDVRWFNDTRVYAALLETLQIWLDAIKPLPEDDDSDVTRQMKEREYDPKTLGRTIAMLHLRDADSYAQRRVEKETKRKTEKDKRQK